MYTLIGGQHGDRTLGDFFQLRIGPDGQAEMSYADSNNIDKSTTPDGMFVKQNSGPSVFASVGTITGPPAPAGGCTSDPAGDATFDTGGVVGSTQPNLDLLQSCLSQPDANHYLITMKVSDLTALGLTRRPEDPPTSGRRSGTYPPPPTPPAERSSWCTWSR